AGPFATRAATASTTSKINGIGVARFMISPDAFLGTVQGDGIGAAPRPRPGGDGVSSRNQWPSMELHRWRRGGGGEGGMGGGFHNESHATSQSGPGSQARYVAMGSTAKARNRLSLPGTVRDSPSPV